ncbi:MAG: alanine--tRNA ligase [Cucumibacter sp.]
MAVTSVSQIREKYVSFFEGEGHTHVASGPLVPRSDPTLMFTNAGMVQFKNVFTGLETRPYKRAVTAQKCVRAGGKHNDLDNVGFTGRHLTFFEMLGNFSFGDYYKAEAIEFAWRLMTREFGLPKGRLTVSVFEEDDEAAGLWAKIAGLGEDRIVRLGAKSNFWQMADTGPCGPNSEIFFDHGEQVAGGPPGSGEDDGDRFVEIWNLVFMQYDQLPGGERTRLPKPSVDTGMGLERMAGVLQGTPDVFETDLFRSIIGETRQLIPDTGAAEASRRVIADHLRSTAFLIAEGLLPSNEGRGYVLRRIMRRAMRHATLLGAAEPVMFRLVPALVREMGQTYPELVRGEAMIAETIRIEEERFLKTLSRGLSILEEETRSLKQGATLAGAVAFKLYDTYGFPLDLTEDALRLRGISVDTRGFDAAMAAQRAEARRNWAGSGETAADAVWFAVAEGTGPTEFLGYETERAEGEIRALVRDGRQVEALAEGEEGFVVLNQTPFYGESGGQVGDTGRMTGEGIEATVLDTSKEAGGVFAHRVKLAKGSLASGDAVALEVDHERRAAIRANHSATHLLHEALRQVLGEHVAQKGSLVAPDRLRFDFSHNKPVSAQELDAVERIANQVIAQDSAVETRLMAVDDAIKAGAMALFGEKYGDEVRVVTMGAGTPGNKVGKTYSMELCGGTHVRATGEIGLVTIVGETSVAAGVRRIEALTAEGARAHFAERELLLKRIAAALKVSPQDAVARIEALIEERRGLERQLAEARRQAAMGGGGGDAGVEAVGGVKYLPYVAEGLPAKELRSLVDEGKKRIGSGVVANVAISDGKATIAVGVTDDLTAKFNAVDLVRIGVAALGGQGGGGRPDLAQGGGPNIEAASAALAAIRRELEAI